VDQVRALGAADHLQVDAERAQRRVGPRQLHDLGVAAHAGLSPRAARLARPIEGMDPQVADEGAEDPRELGDVDACAPVDVGRVLPREDVDAHGNLLGFEGRDTGGSPRA
jgi:hypothetical protein